MLKTISKKTRVQQAGETKLFKTVYNYEQQEGQVPDMIGCRADLKKPNDKEKPMRLDITYYPSSENLQIVVHNKPGDFNVSVVSEVLSEIDELISACKA